MAFSDAEILQHLGFVTEQETGNQTETETPQPTHTVAESALNWLMTGDGDTETESAPFGLAGKPQRQPRRKLATAPETSKTTVEQIPVETSNDKNTPTRTYHMTTRRISHNG